MSGERFARIRDLVLKSSRLPVEERRAYLEAACVDAPELIDEVLSLMAHEDDTLDLVGTGGLERRLAHEDGRGFLAGLPIDSTDEAPEVVDRYQVCEEIGRGGMGVVYRAEQHEPIRRDVALKLVRSGARADVVAARFEAERRTLALMDHSHIARVLDAGTAQDGRPYFVMELVCGLPLTEYCQTHELSLDSRLALLVQICEAVQHAHQKGIVHRDLKPSNVLVREQDGRPIPKVIDFGIAKALGPSDETAMTQEGQPVGTLSYMSPEQARGEIDAIDTRTDVYALGVIAYELVNGSLPYRPEDESLLGMVRVINEDPPIPFSEAAPDRRFDPDLETIVRQALAKDPEERYASVAAFADDIRRLRQSQPILARPPSSAYLVRKLVARNRLPAVLLASLALALVGFGVGMSILFARSEANLRRALSAEQEATQTADLMVDLFEIADPSEARGNEITAREILDRGAERLTADNAELPASRARLQFTLGGVYRGLGLYDRSAEMLNEAWEQRREIAPGAPSSELDADILNDLGRIYQQLDDLAAADSCYTAAIAIKKEIFGADHPKVAASLGNLAVVRMYQGESEEAARLWDLVAQAPLKTAGDSLMFATSLGNMGSFHSQEGRYAAADSCFRRSLAIRQRILPADHPELAISYNNLGALLGDLDRTDEAIKMLEKALAIWRNALGENHPDLATALTSLAILENRRGNEERSEELLLETLALQESAYGPDHIDIAVTLTSLGRLYSEQGRIDLADQALQRSLDIRVEKLGPDHRLVSTTLNSLAELALAQGDLNRAESQLLRAHEIRLAAYGRNSARTSLVVHNLGRLRQAQGRLDEAAVLYQEALEVRTATIPGPDHIRIAQSLAACAAVDSLQGNFARADSLGSLARAMFERLGG